MIPMVWSIRNYVHSGIISKLLHDDFKVVLLVKKHAEHITLSHSNLVIDTIKTLDKKKTSSLRPTLEKIIRSSFNKRNRIKSYKIFNRWFQRNQKLKQRVRNIFIELIGSICTPAPLFNFIKKRYDSIYQQNFNLDEIKEHISSYSPDLYVSTICVSKEEYPYTRIARELGITTFTSIFSFDNLTSRGTIPSFDHYSVWNEKMKSDLISYYPETKRKKIKITGTPQFDFHVNKNIHWSKEQIYRHFDLSDEKKYILYAANHEIFTPSEPKVVAAISQLLAQTTETKDLYIVVRLHPLDKMERWDHVKSDRIIIAKPWLNPIEPDNWVQLTEKDQGYFIGTIKHAKVCLNIASTMSLDAAILDKPVISIAFSTNEEESRAYRSFYKTNHYAPLIASGGTTVAHNTSEVIELIEHFLLNPHDRKKEREIMVKEECGAVDGKSAERIVTTIEKILEENE